MKIDIQASKKLNDQELVDMSLKNKDYFLLLSTRYEKPLLRYIRRLSGLILPANLLGKPDSK